MAETMSDSALWDAREHGNQPGSNSGRPSSFRLLNQVTSPNTRAVSTEGPFQVLLREIKTGFGFGMYFML